MLSFEPTASGTNVTETVRGFGEGSRFDTLYADLREGNAEANLPRSAPPPAAGEGDRNQPLST